MLKQKQLKKKPRAVEFCTKTIEFARNDFKKRYAGSNLGILWAYIQTIMMVVIYWIVFQYGLKNGSVDGVPFLPWFISGMMPWLLFSDIINSTLNCMPEYSYIVKKVVFDVDIIPACKIAVCIFIYIFFLVITIIVAICNHLFTGIFILQTIFYFIALIMLVIPIAYASCTINVFFKDFGQIVTVVLNVLMWATPIVWDIAMLPEKWQWIFKLNPVFYIVSGFRNSLIYGIPVTANLSYMFYFIAIVAALWAVCIPVYRRLLPHLADIL